MWFWTFLCYQPPTPSQVLLLLKSSQFPDWEMRKLLCWCGTPQKHLKALSFGNGSLAWLLCARVAEPSPVKAIPSEEEKLVSACASSLPGPV